MIHHAYHSYSITKSYMYTRYYSHFGIKCQNAWGVAGIYFAEPERRDQRSTCNSYRYLLLHLNLSLLASSDNVSSGRAGPSSPSQLLKSCPAQEAKITLKMAEVEVAGPSVPRPPTISTEEEEAALETGIVASSSTDVVNTAAEEAQVSISASGGMDIDGQEDGNNGQENADGNGSEPNGSSAYASTSASIPTGPAADAVKEETPAKPDPYAIPDNACETLYIQNLNEKVQVEGTYTSCPRTL